jgi:hypothetical protein
MKFKIKYLVGKDLRERNIFADNIDEAEKIANLKFKKWQDIIILTKEKSNGRNYKM